MTPKNILLGLSLALGLASPTIASAITLSATQLSDTTRAAIGQNSPALRINNNGFGFGGGDNTPLRVIDYNTETVTTISDSGSGFPIAVSNNHITLIENPSRGTDLGLLKCEIAPLVSSASLSACQTLNPTLGGLTSGYLLYNSVFGNPQLLNDDGWSLHYEDDGVTATIVLSSPDNQQTPIFTAPVVTGSNFRTIITNGPDIKVYIQRSVAQDIVPFTEVTRIEIPAGNTQAITTSSFQLPSALFLNSVNSQGQAVLSNEVAFLNDPAVPQEIFSCNIEQDQCASMQDITNVLLPPNSNGLILPVVHENGIISFAFADPQNDVVAIEPSLLDLASNTRFVSRELLEQALPAGTLTVLDDAVFLFPSSPGGNTHLAFVGSSENSNPDFAGFDVYLVSLSTGNSNSGNTTLTVTPETTTLDTLLETTLNTQLDLNPNELFAIEVQCTPSNNLLSLQSRTIGDAFPPAPQSLLIDTSNLNQDLYAQAITLSAFVDDQGTFNPAPAPLNAPGVYASLVYQAQPSTAGITDITCTALGSDADGTAQTISVTNATIVLQNGLQDPNGNGQSVTGVVLIPDGVDPSQVTVTLTIGDRSLTTTVDANGFYSFDNVLPTDITVSVDAPRAVAQCTDATVAGEALELADITLYRGDVNNDGDINIADFTAISSRFGLNEGDDRYRPRFDLNRDGTINIQDLAILGSAMGLSNCNPTE